MIVSFAVAPLYSMFHCDAWKWEGSTKDGTKNAQMKPSECESLNDA